MLEISLHKNLKSVREKYGSDYLSESIRENPKHFWLFIKHLKKDDPGEADFKVDSQIINGSEMKLDLLNQQFTNNKIIILKKILLVCLLLAILPNQPLFP